MYSILLSCSLQASTASGSTSATDASSAQSRFLTSSSPAAVKRTVLASFTDLMLLPVTIVPRTVNTVGSLVATGGRAVATGGSAVGSAAVNGIAMLNPVRWVGSAGVSSTIDEKERGKEREAYGGTSVEVREKDTIVFKVMDDEEEDEDDLTGKVVSENQIRILSLIARRPQSLKVFLIVRAFTLETQTVRGQRQPTGHILETRSLPLQHPLSRRRKPRLILFNYSSLWIPPLPLFMPPAKRSSVSRPSQHIRLITGIASVKQSRNALSSLCRSWAPSTSSKALARLQNR